MTKVLGLVFSARTGGNLYDMATYLFSQVAQVAPQVETEVIETAKRKVSPCNGCAYECLYSKEPGYQCPIDDDVSDLWRQALTSDLLVYFISTYGGMPPATWVAFQQRYHSVFRWLRDEAPCGQIAAVTIYSPMGTRAGDTSQSVIVHHLACNPRKLLAYEPIIPENYNLNGLQDKLIVHPEIRCKLDRLGKRIADTLGAGAT